MTTQFVEVYTARDLIHAYLLKGALEEAGLEVRITNENLQGALGDLPPGLATSPGILVLESEKERAAQILGEIEEGIAAKRAAGGQDAKEDEE